MKLKTEKDCIENNIKMMKRSIERLKRKPKSEKRDKAIREWEGRIKYQEERLKKYDWYTNSISRIYKDG